MFLADSDVLIDALNGRRHAVDLIARHERDEMFVSIVTLGEIYHGTLGARDPHLAMTNAQGLIAPYPVLQLSKTIMLQFAQIRLDLRRVGNSIPDFDLLIGSTALVYDSYSSPEIGVTLNESPACGFTIYREKQDFTIIDVSTWPCYVMCSPLPHWRGAAVHNTCRRDDEDQ